MTDTKLFTTPAEAVACLREALDHATMPYTDRGNALLRQARAALESLEAALSTERESNTANMAELHRADARIGEQAARIRALESELAEKTAALVEYANAEGGHDPGCDCALHKNSGSPVALDRGEGVAGSLLKYPEQGELWDAINDYTTACGGRPDKHVGSIVRMNAVAAVESVVRAMLRRVSALPSEPVIALEREQERSK